MPTQPTPPAAETHFVPLPGKTAYRRVSLCGVRTSVRGFDLDQGFAYGSSRFENVSCPACLRLAALVSEAA